MLRGSLGREYRMKRYIIGAVLGVILGATLSASAVPPPSGATPNQRLNALCRVVVFKPNATRANLEQACSTEIPLH